MIELYDVGRVILGPFDAGYRFIAEQGHRHIPDSAALGRITAFHRNRSIGLCQEDFDLLNKAWVEAIRNRELHVNPGELVYPDVKPRFEKVKARGDSVILHTSGSKELVELLVGDEYMYDSVLQGSETGDKNHPETFAGICDDLEGNIRAFYDDKPSVLRAAHAGFELAGGHPSLYLVDRSGRVSHDDIAVLESKGVIRISGFDENEMGVHS